MAEEAITRQILDLLKRRGIPAWRTHDTRHHPVEPGIADINAVLPGGVFLAVEVKDPARRTAHADRRARQDGWMEMIRRAGGKAWPVASVEEMDRALFTMGIR